MVLLTVPARHLESLSVNVLEWVTIMAAVVSVTASLSALYWVAEGAAWKRSELLHTKPTPQTREPLQWQPPQKSAQSEPPHLTGDVTPQVSLGGDAPSDLSPRKPEPRQAE